MVERSARACDSAYPESDSDSDGPRAVLCCEEQRSNLEPAGPTLVDSNRLVALLMATIWQNHNQTACAAALRAALAWLQNTPTSAWPQRSIGRDASPNDPLA